MQLHSATRRELVLSEWSRGAQEADCSNLITEDTTVLVDGAIKAIYLKRVNDPVIDRMATALPKVKTQQSTRTNGLVTQSRIFGYAPRNHLRRRPCTTTSLAQEQPEIHALIAGAATVLSRLYYETWAEAAASHDQVVASKVKQGWRLCNTMFTSGIVNRNNPLNYHFDSGNFQNCCSAMLGFKQDVEGGHLVVPELDVKFEIADGSCLFFDGQGMLHGVTPIRIKKPTATRHTVVYYSLKQMWNCEMIEDEIALARARRLETERRALGDASERRAALGLDRDPK